MDIFNDLNAAIVFAVTETENGFVCEATRDDRHEYGVVLPSMFDNDEDFPYNETWTVRMYKRESCVDTFRDLVLDEYCEKKDELKEQRKQWKLGWLCFAELVKESEKCEDIISYLASYDTLNTTTEAARTWLDIGYDEYLEAKEAKAKKAK